MQGRLAPIATRYVIIPLQPVARRLCRNEAVMHRLIPLLHSVGVTHRLVVGGEFAALPFQRQLELFLADIEHPAQAYPAWLARTIKANAADLPSDVRQALLWRVRGLRYGPWRQLKRRLAALECVRRNRDFAWPWDTGGRTG